MSMFTEPFEIIDLGVYPDQAAYPPWGYKAKHVSHAQGAHAMARFLNLREFQGAQGELAASDFPEALGLAWTQVNLSDHAGNHIDAPYHFGPTVEGQPAKTIDQVPLSWCSGPGVRLDFRTHQGRDISAEDLRRELARIEVVLSPGAVPLLWTGADQYIDDKKEYWPRQAGLSLEGLNYLLDQGVRLIGIDAYAMDVSHATMQRQQAEGDGRFFPLHFVGRAREHMHLEKLTNLGALPRPSGFFFAAFPIKLRGASAGWVRPVAMVPQSHFPKTSPGGPK
ncbi:MAG TPA: cyclase family protein [Pseudomonadota bacterium]|nr:cyclase family protein [Pseudomonadota bacterium]